MNKRWAKGSRGVHDTAHSEKLRIIAMNEINKCKRCAWDNNGTCIYNATCCFPKDMFKAKEQD